MLKKILLIALSVSISACVSPQGIASDSQAKRNSFKESAERATFSLKVNNYYAPSGSYIGMCKAAVESFNKIGRPIDKGFTIDDLPGGFQSPDWKVMDNRDHFRRINMQKVEYMFRDIEPTKIQNLDLTFTPVETISDFAHERSKQYDWLVDKGGKILESHIDVNGDGLKEHVVAILNPQRSDLPVNYDRGMPMTNPQIFGILDGKGNYDPRFKAIEVWTPFLHQKYPGVGLAKWVSNEKLNMEINYVQEAVMKPNGTTLRRPLCEINQQTNSLEQGE